MNHHKPIIGITMGDPAGIGPEIAVKVFVQQKIYDFCQPLLVGDAAVIESTVRWSGNKIRVNPITAVEQAMYQPGVIDVYDLKNVGVQKLELGKISAIAGNAAFEAIKTVIELALQKKIDATVTGPIQKESINLAGHPYSGHTEIYAHYTHTRKYAMLLVEENLRVIHVSTHLSLRQACDAVKKERILDVIELLNDTCQKVGISRPKIGVAALNPHAGENGLFGTEEILEICPAVEQAKSSGYRVDGPIPADTIFSKAQGGLYDGIVAMYHDQGHIPFKLLGFQWDKANNRMKSVRGVNITLGLPIIRTSVDHGTAMEIAGRGIASPDALFLAIKYATEFACTKKMKNQSIQERI